MILVDTSVWIDFLNGANSKERHALHRLIEEEEDISITEIILTEILQGIKDDEDFRRTKNYLLEFPLQKPKGIETYLKAAKIFRDCRKKGKTIRKTADCIIAAICVENDLILLHKDGDFDVMETCAGLRVLKI
ncbi:MAG: PIN domain nuclease [Magnetococcales bacterium]|nr:PIN domain nuclease [Magnetococcales bacterium]